MGMRGHASLPSVFAILWRGDLRLVLSQPGGQNVGGGSSLADGRKPDPSGWNRFAVEVDDVRATAKRLRGAGVRLRSQILQGVGGNQALLEDRSRNPIVLFQPLDPKRG
jgi:catechol 2,3-dioxygenase-like lactoylglutathione lyase family enzyme